MPDKENKVQRNRDYMAQYMREYRREHPDKNMEWRVRAAVTLLTRHGYTVTPPTTAANRAEV